MQCGQFAGGNFRPQQKFKIFIFACWPNFAFSRPALFGPARAKTGKFASICRQFGRALIYVVLGNLSFFFVLTHLPAYPLSKAAIANELKKVTKSWSKDACFFFGGYPDFAFSEQALFEVARPGTGKIRAIYRQFDHTDLKPFRLDVTAFND